ncbi:MAG: hypothetical protein WDO13_11575 [Verrucomicrobiota bacterium]
MAFPGAFSVPVKSKSSWAGSSFSLLGPKNFSHQQVDLLAQEGVFPLQLRDPFIAPTQFLEKLFFPRAGHSSLTPQSQPRSNF